MDTELHIYGVGDYVLELHTKGNSAKEFVMKNKTGEIQSGRMIQLIQKEFENERVVH